MRNHAITLLAVFAAFLVFVLALLKHRGTREKDVDAYHCVQCDDHDCVCRKVTESENGKTR